MSALYDALIATGCSEAKARAADEEVRAYLRPARSFAVTIAQLVFAVLLAVMAVLMFLQGRG